MRRERYEGREMCVKRWGVYIDIQTLYVKDLGFVSLGLLPILTASLCFLFFINLIIFHNYQNQMPGIRFINKIYVKIDNKY